MTKTKDKEKVEENQAESAEPVNRDKVRLISSVSHTYDVDRVFKFIDMVFHVEPPKGAEPLYYATKNSAFGPGMPLQGGDEGLEKLLTRSHTGQALYFGMSSAYRDDEGVLRHKRDLFAALHVVVLDDIGTKIDPDILPDNFEPTYIIESSPGNYQYGYVLAEPVTRVEQASAVVQLVGLSGFTDSGGIMPTKIVRLPDGINGKPVDEKRAFNVKLVKDDGPYWPVELLIERLNVEVDGDTVTWAMIQNGYAPVAKKYKADFLPLRPVAQGVDGSVDQVLEWLYASDRVVGDSGGEWVDIECPRSHMHSPGGGLTAGYKPLGRGAQPKIRAFHCFHEHCSDLDTKEFLSFVLANSDIRLISQYDPSMDIFGRYVFDAVNNRVWSCTGSVLAHNIDGFKTQYNETTTAYRIGRENKLMPGPTTAANLWLTSPYRPVVHGGVHDPAGDTLVRDENGALWVNSYRAPSWGDGPYDEKHVKQFEEFLHYLIPDKDSYEYVLDWCSMKMKDTTFRGTGLVMVAEAFGVGRSTFGNMLSTLVGETNAATVPFDTFLNPGSYNHWEDKQLIVIPESREAGSRQETRGAYKAYEILKQRIDTTVQNTTINVKYQPQRMVKGTASYLILTNHLNAIAKPENDRRLTVIRNPDRPNPPRYFVNLYAWLNQQDDQGRALWARHVYRWLRARKVKNEERLLRPLDTDAGRAMNQEMAPAPKLVAQEIARTAIKKDIAFITTPQFRKLMDHGTAIYEAHRGQMEYTESYLRHCMDDYSIAFQHYRQRHVGSTNADRVRLFKEALKCDMVPEYPEDTGRYVKAEDLSPKIRARCKHDLDRLNDEWSDFTDALTKALQALV